MGIRQLAAYTEWLERQGIVTVPDGQTHDTLAKGFMQAGQPDQDPLPFNVVDSTTTSARDTMPPNDSLTDWPED